MVDPEITALLRGLIGKFPDDAVELDAAMHNHVVPERLEPAGKDGASVDDFTQAGRKALRPIPTMWR